MIIGILIGISICSFLILAEIWLSNRTIGLNKLRSIIKQQNKAQIIKPQDQKEKDIYKIIEENEKKGLDTPIEELWKE